MGWWKKTHTLWNLPLHVWDKRHGKEEIQRIIKVCSLWRTLRTYTIDMVMVFCGTKPMHKTWRWKSIPHLNHNPRMASKPCIPHCYNWTASLKMYLHWPISGLQSHTQKWNNILTLPISKCFNSTAAGKTHYAGQSELKNNALQHNQSASISI